MENEQIEKLAKTLYLNYDLPQDFAADVAKFLYEEDYRKIRKGEWILNHGIIDYYTCSVCGSMISQSQINRFYCPRCGAEMLIPEEEED